MFSGSEFHKAGAAQEKARSPADTNLERGILSKKRSDERRLQLWDLDEAYQRCTLASYHVELGTQEQEP